MSVFKKKEKTEKSAPRVVKDEDGNVVPQYVHDTEFQQRREGETQQAYNERVPIQFQPLAEVGEYSYLGKKRK